jgi:chlorite dismutase
VVPFRGESLPAVPCLDVVLGEASIPVAGFRLRGVTSNERYVTGDEKHTLVERQKAIFRDGASFGALIPIKKSDAWWALPQDERRAIFEERSRHIAIGLEALPAVARRLHHCRDLGTTEPFDFLTWFDYEPKDESRFDDLLGALRATPEWEFVEREVEVRVARIGT